MLIVMFMFKSNILENRPRNHNYFSKEATIYLIERCYRELHFLRVQYNKINIMHIFKF